MRNPGKRIAMQEITMERAVEAANWEAALSAVERNAGAPGPDGLKSEELREHLAKHGEGIKAPHDAKKSPNPMAAPGH